MDLFETSLDEARGLADGLMEENEPLAGGWTFNGRSSDVDIFVQQVGDDLYNKGIGELDVPPGVARQLLGQLQYRALWDDMYA